MAAVDEHDIALKDLEKVVLVWASIHYRHDRNTAGNFVEALANIWVENHSIDVLHRKSDWKIEPNTAKRALIGLPVGEHVIGSKVSYLVCCTPFNGGIQF